MLIDSLCPKCGFEHGLSDKLLGETILCQKCGESFVVIESVEADVPAAFDMETTFLRDENVEVLPARLKDKPQLQAQELGKTLTVPPPPRELWSRKSDGEDDEEGFRTFKHDSRAVRDFLERDQGSDYSWLLVGGLVLMTLMLMTFQCVMGLVILW
jgi:hypothetical protein